MTDNPYHPGAPPWGYPGPVAPAGRPGPVTAAVVLMLVAGGLHLVIAAAVALAVLTATTPHLADLALLAVTGVVGVTSTSLGVPVARGLRVGQILAMIVSGLTAVGYVFGFIFLMTVAANDEAGIRPVKAAVVFTALLVLLAVHVGVPVLLMRPAAQAFFRPVPPAAPRPAPPAAQRPGPLAAPRPW